MKIVAVGLNHKTAPISVRDESVIHSDYLINALDLLKESGMLLESCIISTCNRTEVYGVTDNHNYIEKHPELLFNMIYPKEKKGMFTPYLYFYKEREAIQHLFRVSLGLDSLIYGETEIFGQIKRAYYTALENGNTGSVSNKFFNRLIHSTKKIRTAVQITEGNTSVGYAAVQLAKNIVGDLAKSNILVIGAGEIGRLTVNQFINRGAKNIVIANRTYERAVQLAEEVNGKAVKFDDIEEHIAKSGVVVTAIKSNASYIDKEMILPILKRRGHCPLFFIDLGSPRNVSPDVTNNTKVFLYNIDDLKTIVTSNFYCKKNRVELAESVINKEINELMEWLRLASVIPVIQKLEGLHEELIRKNGTANEESSAKIERIKKQINEDIMKIPMYNLKTLVTSRHAKKYADSFKTILEESDFAETPHYHFSDID